jgi:Zn-dependent protease with chaperone function
VGPRENVDIPSRRPSELTLPSVNAMALFAATLLAELPVVFVRMLFAILAGAAVVVVKTHSLHGAGHDAKYAFVVTAWSVFALITPVGGGWWWRQHMGGRDPSERAQIAYQDAIELLQHQSQQPLRLPSSWFVVDTPQPDAAVCGHTLLISRGLTESEFLPAVLAHELGHLNSSDGRLTAALNRLVVHPPPMRRETEGWRPEVVVLSSDRLTMSVTVFGLALWTCRRAFRFAKGGFGLRLLAPAWGSYWREREYEADQYAARLGQGYELADFLEIHALIHDHPVPFIWLTEHTHPPTELRIRLRKATWQAPQIAPGPEPVKAAPAGPPTAGPDGPTLTEPDPSTGRALTSAGRPLPTTTANRKD